MKMQNDSNAINLLIVILTLDILTINKMIVILSDKICQS